MANTHKYTVFGLTIESEFEIPELFELQAPGAGVNTDISISFSNVPDDLPGYKSKGVLFRAKPGKLLFWLDSVGRYLISGGKKIEIERLNNSTDDEIRLFLLGVGFGALLHQRKLFPFHGNAVVKDGKAIILAGNSGAGKSTLAAVLLKRGYKLLADDISVIDFIEDQPVVYPGIPQLKLWEDVIIKLGESTDYKTVRPTLKKYKKPVKDALSGNPVSLTDIFIIGTKNSEGFEHEVLKGVEKFNLVKDNTYRFRYVEGLGLTQSHFRQAGKLAGKVNIVKVKRPSSPLLLEELGDYFEGVFGQE